MAQPCPAEGTLHGPLPDKGLLGTYPSARETVNEGNLADVHASAEGADIHVIQVGAAAFRTRPDPVGKRLFLDVAFLQQFGYPPGRVKQPSGEMICKGIRIKLPGKRVKKRPQFFSLPGIEKGQEPEIETFTEGIFVHIPQSVPNLPGQILHLLFRPSRSIRRLPVTVQRKFLQKNGQKGRFVSLPELPEHMAAFAAGPAPAEDKAVREASAG